MTWPMDRYQWLTVRHAVTGHISLLRAIQPSLRINRDTDLDIVLPDKVPKVENVCRECVARRLSVLVFWCRLVATAEGHL